jgi:hypothetical protein
MPVDCVPFEERYCIPSYYADAIDEGGIFRRVDKRGQLIEVDPSAVRRVGAQINLRHVDNFSPTPVAGMAVRSFGALSLYYAFTCQGLSCMMRMALIPRERGAWAERCGTFVSEFQVVGTSPEGLKRALESIRLRIPDHAADEGPTLASFAPHVQPTVTFASDCFPRRGNQEGQ